MCLWGKMLDACLEPPAFYSKSWPAVSAHGLDPRSWPTVLAHGLGPRSRFHLSRVSQPPEGAAMALMEFLLLWL